MARREFANLPTTPRETGTVVVKTTGGALADISLTVDGDAIAGSTLDVTADGIIPTFYGPPDGADSVVVTMRQHGLDWDAAVFASDSPPAVSGGSTQIGQAADQANYSLAVALSDGVAYTLKATDLSAGDSALTPADNNTFEMASDGSVSLPAGAYLINSYASAHYAAAPDETAFLTAAILLAGDPDAHVVRIRTTLSPDDPLLSDGGGDGQWEYDAAAQGDSVSTDLSASRSVLLMLNKPMTLTLAITSQGASAELREAELNVIGMA